MKKRDVLFSSLGCCTPIAAIYLLVSMKYVPFEFGILVSFIASLYLGIINTRIPTTVVSAILTSFLTIVFLSFLLSLPAFLGYVIAPGLFIFTNIAWIVRFLPIIFATNLAAGIMGCILNEFFF